MKTSTTIQIKKLNPIEWAFLLMVIGMGIAPNTVIGYILCTYFIAYIFLTRKNKLKISFYFVIELMLIIYLIFQFFIGVRYEQAQFTGIRTLLISFIFNFALYQFLVCQGVSRASDLYATGNIISDFILLLFYFGTIFHSGGLSAIELKGFSVLKIGGVASVNIGWINVISIVLLWPNYLKSKDKNTLIKIGILLTFAILTGRRKIFLLLFVSLIIGTYLFYSSKGIKQAFKGIIMGIIGVCIIWFMIMKIPVLYEFLGRRLQNAFMVIFENDNGMDSSINMRNQLTVKAINAWKNNIVFGQGYNAFSKIYNNGGYYSHNNYLELLVSFGVLGTGIYYMKYIYLLIKIWISQLQKKMPQWYSIYYIANMMAFCVLEMYQITYMYRSLTVFLIFCLYVASNKNDGGYSEF